MQKRVCQVFESKEDSYVEEWLTVQERYVVQ